MAHTNYTRGEGDGEREVEGRRVGRRFWGRWEGKVNELGERVWVGEHWL